MKKLLILLLVARTAPALADDRAAAERYFRAGAKAFAAQNFEAAATDFDEAYKQLPLPEIAFSAAQAYRRLYRIDPKPEYVKRSVELYRVYLDKVKTGGRVADAADNLADMQHELDKLTHEGAKFTTTEVAHTRLGVSVTTGGDASAMTEIGDATGAQTRGLHATIDGQPVEPFALVDVDAKEHTLAASADGYLPAEKKVMAVSGQSQLIELELKPKPAVVQVTTDDGADIAVDGRAGSPRLELAAGKHVIEVTARGREPFAREITVTRGQQLTVDAPLEKTARRKAVPYVLGGAGLLAIAAGATALVAESRDSDASKLRDQIRAGNAPPSTADKYDAAVQSRDHYVTATWVLGGAAVAAATTGVLLYWLDKPAAEHLTINPTASGGSVTFSGRF
ncbi:MAG: PEGA domain-containing protein [Deltaproteobacteria bacterium]|nr:PEGA domain-containing protein [Deltaproteobacteria bacterium]